MHTMDDLEPGDKVALYSHEIGESTPFGLVGFKITEVYETWFEGYIEDLHDARDGEVMSFDDCDAIAKIY